LNVRCVVSYILITIVLIQLVGATVYFEASRYAVRKEIKARIKSGLSKKDLLVLTFSKQAFNTLHWLNRNEFERNGDLFDVVHVKKLSSGAFEIQCISDVKEKELFRYVGRETASNLGNEDHPTPLFNWVKLLHSPSLVPEINNDLPIFNVDQKTKIAANYQFMFSDAELSIESPPPCFFG
jgi:hypothetical protein